MGQAKLTRALMRGGIAERRADGDYHIWRGQNRRRRALGVLQKRRGDELRADGKLTLLAGETSLYTWAGEVAASETSKVQLPAGLGRSGQRRAPRRLLARALETVRDERARVRLADAAKRFLADSECASSGAAITMNWQALSTGCQGRVPRATDHLPGYARARATQRLGQVAEYVGEARLQLLDWILVHEMSAAELARRLNIRPAATPDYAAHLLRDLAEAYDLTVERM